MSNFSNVCPSNAKPVGNTDNIGVMGSMLLDKLGADHTCNTSSFAASLAGKFNGPLGLASGSVAASVNNVTNSGCEAIQTVLGNYLNSVYLSKCIVNNTNISATVDVTITQTANFSASGGGVIHPPVDCPGGQSIVQKVKVSLKDLTKLDTSTQNKIGEVVKQGMSNTIDQLQSQKNGFQNTPEGAKSLTSMQSTVNNMDSSSAIQNAFNEARQTIKAYQSSDWSASGAGSQLWAPCKIDQETIMELQIADIISNAYASTLSTELTAFMSNAVSQSQEIKNEAAPSALTAVFGNSNIWMIVGGIVAALIIGFIVVKVMKNKKAQEALGNVAKGDIGSLAKTATSMAFRRKRNY